MNRTVLALTALVLTAALSACGTQPPANGPPAAAGPYTTAPAAAVGDARPKMGDGAEHGFPNGLTVNVSGPAVVTFSTLPGDLPRNPATELVGFTITATNTSTEPINTQPLLVNISAGTVGTTVLAAYDTATGVESSFGGTLAPGRKKTVKYAYTVPKADAAVLDMQVTYGWTVTPGGTILFAGSVT